MLARNTAGLFTIETLLASAARYEENNRHAVTDFEASTPSPMVAISPGGINTQHVLASESQRDTLPREQPDPTFG